MNYENEKSKDELIAYAKGLESCLFEIHNRFWFKRNGEKFETCGFTGDWFGVAQQVYFADFLMRSFGNTVIKTKENTLCYKTFAKFFLILMAAFLIVLDILYYFGICVINTNF